MRAAEAYERGNKMISTVRRRPRRQEDHLIERIISLRRHLREGTLDVATNEPRQRRRLGRAVVTCAPRGARERLKAGLGYT